MCCGGLLQVRRLGLVDLQRDVGGGGKISPFFLDQRMKNALFFSSHASVFKRDMVGGGSVLHPGGGMATSTYLSAAPPLSGAVCERVLPGHRTRRTLCDVPVSGPNIDDLYCSIPKYKRQRPKSLPAQKKMV